MSGADVLLQVQELRKVYKTTDALGKHIEFAAVKGATFEVDRGEVFGLIGESGSGKSTIGRMVLRLLEPTSGTVSFDGYDLLQRGPRPLRRLRQHMQIVFQDSGSAFNPRVVVGDQVAYTMKKFDIHPKREIPDRVAELLEKVGLSPDMAKRYPHEFSGGQRQRLGIARALACNPEFIVLDEPTSALDVSVQQQVLELLKQLQHERQLTMLLITHNLAVVQYMCDRAAVLHHGELMETGTVDQLFGNPQAEITRLLLDAVLEPTVP